MMKNCDVFALALLALAATGLNCAGSMRGFTEPTETGALVIGSVLVGCSGFQGVYDDYNSGIEVIIVGRHKVDGEDKFTGYTVWTDRDGYFSLSNVPEGEYAVKGIKVQLGGQHHVTIATELSVPEDEFSLRREEQVMFSGDFFDAPTENRICDLSHRIFIIHRTGQIAHKRISKSEGLKLVGSDTFVLPYPQQYFMKKHPDSGWIRFLEADLERVTAAGT